MLPSPTSPTKKAALNCIHEDCHPYKVSFAGTDFWIYPSRTTVQLVTRTSLVSPGCDPPWNRVCPPQPLLPLLAIRGQARSVRECWVLQQFCGLSQVCSRLARNHMWSCVSESEAMVSPRGHTCIHRGQGHAWQVLT